MKNLSPRPNKTVILLASLGLIALAILISYPLLKPETSSAGGAMPGIPGKPLTQEQAFSQQFLASKAANESAVEARNRTKATTEKEEKAIAEKERRGAQNTTKSAMPLSKP